jgi:hypothetical protein
MPHRPLLTITRKADIDLSTHARKVVKATASNGCTLTTGAGADVPLGVIYNKPRATVGTAVGIIISGTAEVRAAAAFAANIPLMADANGRVLTATATNYVVGVSLQAAAALDDVVEMRMTAPGTKFS